MAGKNSLQLLRGSTLKLTGVTLLPGQPLYDRSTKILYIGSGSGSTTSSLSNSNVFVSGIKNDHITIDASATYAISAAHNNNVANNNDGAVKLNKLILPSESAGSTYNSGTETTSGIKKIVKSNGNTVYWDDENNHHHQKLSASWGASDSRSVVTKPADYLRELTYVGIKYGSAINNPGNMGDSNYATLIGLSPWHDNSGGPAHELAFNASGFFYRLGAKTSTTWDAWQQVLTSSLFEATTSNIKMNGTLAVGTRSTVARGDHVHPRDTTKFDVAGGTITGDVTINEDLTILKTLTIDGVLFLYDDTSECLKISF